MSINIQDQYSRGMNRNFKSIALAYLDYLKEDDLYIPGEFCPESHMSLPHPEDKSNDLADYSRLDQVLPRRIHDDTYGSSFQSKQTPDFRQVYLSIYNRVMSAGGDLSNFKFLFMKDHWSYIRRSSMAFRLHWLRFMLTYKGVENQFTDHMIQVANYDCRSYSIDNAEALVGFAMYNQISRSWYNSLSGTIDRGPKMLQYYCFFISELVFSEPSLLIVDSMLRRNFTMTPVLMEYMEEVPESISSNSMYYTPFIKNEDSDLDTEFLRHTFFDPIQDLSKGLFEFFKKNEKEVFGGTGSSRRIQLAIEFRFRKMIVIEWIQIVNACGYRFPMTKHFCTHYEDHLKDYLSKYRDNLKHGFSIKAVAKLLCDVIFKSGAFRVGRNTTDFLKNFCMRKDSKKKDHRAPHFSAAGEQVSLVNGNYMTERFLQFDYLYGNFDHTGPERAAVAKQHHMSILNIFELLFLGKTFTWQSDDWYKEDVSARYLAPAYFEDKNSHLAKSDKFKQAIFSGATVAAEGAEETVKRPAKRRRTSEAAASKPSESAAPQPDVEEVEEAKADQESQEEEDKKPAAKKKAPSQEESEEDKKPAAKKKAPPQEPVQMDEQDEPQTEEKEDQDATQEMEDEDSDNESKDNKPLSTLVKSTPRRSPRKRKASPRKKKLTEEDISTMGDADSFSSIKNLESLPLIMEPNGILPEQFIRQIKERCAINKMLDNVEDYYEKIKILSHLSDAFFSLHLQMFFLTSCLGFNREIEDPNVKVPYKKKHMIKMDSDIFDQSEIFHQLIMHLDDYEHQVYDRNGITRSLHRVVNILSHPRHNVTKLMLEEYPDVKGHGKDGIDIRLIVGALSWISEDTMDKLHATRKERVKRKYPPRPIDQNRLEPPDADISTDEDDGDQKPAAKPTRSSPRKPAPKRKRDA